MDFVDEHHQRIVEFAEDFLDDDDEREGFVDALMERRGYTRQSSWGPPDQGGAAGGRAPLVGGGGQHRRRAPAQPPAPAQGGGGRRSPYFKPGR